MWEDKEVKALLQIIDDPDEEVYDIVAGRIMSYGRSIIPNLEQLWEATEDEGVQNRIETLIHRVHFEKLEEDFHEWASERQPGLLSGALLVARLRYPELSTASIMGQVDAMRRNIWLELNNYLTPLEQVNVFNSILYSYYRLQGRELGEREPGHFFINNVLESRQGNAYTIGILYLVLCEMLDIPVFAVDVPRQLVFAYIDAWHPFLHPDRGDVAKVSFFVDPLNGSVYTRRDVEAYLHKLGVRLGEEHYTPIDARRVIYKMMEELHFVTATVARKKKRMKCNS